MRFQLYCDKRNKWRWRLIAKNGKIMADSGEGYYDKPNCVRALRRVQRADIPELPIEELACVR